MKLLPEKKAKTWGSFFATYAIIIFASLFLAQSILHSKLEVKSILALILIAVVTTLFSCIGGYLGAKSYFFSSSLGLVAGIIYMLYIAVFNASPGWGDITSVIGYLFFAAIGIVIGVFIEILALLQRKLKK